MIFPRICASCLMAVTEYFWEPSIGLLDHGETDTLTQLANRKTFGQAFFEPRKAQDDAAG